MLKRWRTAEGTEEMNPGKKRKRPGNETLAVGMQREHRREKIRGQTSRMKPEF